MRTFLTLLLLLGALTAARAHAFLDHADPRVGSVLRQPPVRVTLWMTEALEPAFTTLRVLDARGMEVDRKNATIRGATLAVSLPKLAPGVYTVVWKAVATDTHVTRGTFTFTWRP